MSRPVQRLINRPFFVVTPQYRKLGEEVPGLKACMAECEALLKKETHLHSAQPVFFDIVQKAQQAMESEAAKESLFGLDPHLFYVNGNSPIKGARQDILWMCYEKAFTKHHWGGKRSNHAGYTLLGARGNGKSTLLQSTCMISGILLPDLFTVYADFQNSGAGRTPAAKLNDAHAMAFSGSQYESSTREPGETVMGQIIRELWTVHGVSPVLFLDEFHLAYTKENAGALFEQLHPLVTGFKSAVFVASSASYVQSIIRQDEMVLKEKGLYYDSSLGSLNDTKLSAKYVGPFTSRAQYVDYLRCRPDMEEVAKEKFEAAKKNGTALGCDHIEHWHAMTGSGFRDTEKGGITGPMSSVNLPLSNTVEYYVLRKLFEQQRICGTPPDLFELVSVSEQCIVQWIREAFPDYKTPHALVHDLQESRTLRITADGQLTFYAPQQYIMLSKHVDRKSVV